MQFLVTVLSYLNKKYWWMKLMNNDVQVCTVLHYNCILVVKTVFIIPLYLLNVAINTSVLCRKINLQSHLQEIKAFCQLVIKWPCEIYFQKVIQKLTYVFRLLFVTWRYGHCVLKFQLKIEYTHCKVNYQ